MSAELRQQVAAAVAALGDTADAVAQTLRGGGWKGQPGHCGSCPVARMLVAMLGPGYRVNVSETVVKVYRGDHELFSVALPPGVRLFLCEFDLGHKYSDLRDVA